MQHHLTPQELAEHFTLLPQEQALLAHRRGINQLGIAVLLKYFQWEGRFPTAAQEIPQAVVQHLAETLRVPADRFTRYDLEGRMARYHKEEIRQWTGWRPDTVHDAETIQAWVGAHTRVEEATLPHVLAHLTAHYKHLKIEVPTTQRLERLAHAVTRPVEDQFFTTLAHALSPEMCQQLDTLLTEAPSSLSLTALKTAPGRRSLPSLEVAVAQLQQLQSLVLPQELLAPLSPRYLRRLKLRVAAESLYALRRHPAHIRYALLVLFCHVRTQELTDHVIESLLHLVHKMDTHAEKRVDEVLLTDFKRVPGKPRLLFQLAEVSLAQPEGQVKAVIYPAVGEQTLRDVVAEGRASGATYRDKVHTVLQSSYSHHSRRMVPQILSVLTLRATNAQQQPMLEALDLLRQYAGRKQRFYGAEDEVPLDGVIPRAERSRVVEQTPQGQTRVHRVKYEIAVLQGLRERLRCKEIWVPGAQRYRNPDDDLPPDFPTQRPTYYQALDKPLAVDTFLTDLQHQMTQALQRLDTSMPTNTGGKILQRPRGWIRVSPSERQPDPPTLAHLKAEVLRRWPMTSLLDVLKETDLRVDFTRYFTGTGTRTVLDRASLQRRLLLCLFGLGTNTGLKRVCATLPEDAYHELLYVRRHYLHADALRNAIAHVANAIFRIRAAPIWAEGTTACASDAKHFGAWDQNLVTEWHLRYGGRGVMVYWHVEKRAVCIYSQLKTVSSSEVATRLEGLLRHGTEMPLEKNYVDSHGQSEVAFAFCHLLNFQLLPRLKGIHRQKLYRPTTGQPEAYPHLQAILTRPIRWDLIRQHYETMIQYATALRLGTADAETILKRFTRSPFPHPTYHAVIELGKVIKTIFLCQYLQEEALRREINDGLQVIENWNSANDFIFYGKGGEMATNRLEDQEVAVLALHLLQIALVYINTLMLQHVLADPAWRARMTPRDLQALTPLIYLHINPYGTFHLDMQTRLRFEAA